MMYLLEYIGICIILSVYILWGIYDIISKYFKTDELVKLEYDKEQDEPNNIRPLNFKEFMLNIGILNIATVKDCHVCKINNIEHPIFGNVVYIIINGTNVCYPCPRQSLENYPVLNRRIDGSFNTDNVIKTPDDNIILVLNDFNELEFPEMFRFVFVHIMTGNIGRYFKEGSDFHNKIKPIFDFYGITLKSD